MFYVKVRNKAAKSAKKMPEFYKKRIAELFETLKVNPIPAELYDIEKMEGADHAYRIRIGSMRILYDVVKEAGLVEIIRIEWRGRAYK